MDAGGGNAREVTHNDIEEVQPELSPDDAQILFLAETNEKLEPYYNSNAVRDAGRRRHAEACSLPDFPYAIDQAAWAPDGASILAVANMGVHSEIIQIDVAIEAVEAADRAATTTSRRRWSVVPPAGQMVFQFDEPDAVRRRVDAGDSRDAHAAAAAPVRVTGVFDALDRTFALPRQEKVSWKSADGTTIEGLLFYPIGLRRRAAVSARRADARRTGRLRQVRRGPGPAPQLLSGADRHTATPSSGPTTAAAPATATPSIATSSAATSRTCTSTSWPAWTR